MKLDDIDFKILKILQENGRITNLQLSSEVGLSPAPTLERVKKLEQSGYIKSYHAIVDHRKLGLDISAFLQISLNIQKKNAILSLVEQLQNVPEVVECHQITGSSDFLLKVITKNLESYEHLIREKLTKIEEISQIQTMMVLSTYKDAGVMTN